MDKKIYNLKKKDYYRRNPEIYKNHLEICRKWYEKNKEKDLNDGRVWAMKNRDIYQKTKKIWRNKNIEKIKSYHQKEKKKNILSRMNKQKLRKNFCEICNSNEKLENHHWNYDKPLLINTLCKECHKIQHIKNFDNWHQSRLLANMQLGVLYNY